MKRLQCDLNQKFGYWTVIDNTPISDKKHIYVKVQCKCGKIQLVSLSDLYNKRTTGCKNCKARERSKILSIGDKFKHWTIIDGPKIHHGTLQYLCLCDCGQTTRWINYTELQNSNKRKQCQKCFGKKLSQKITKNNGRIGDLTQSKYGRIKRIAKTRNINFDVSLQYLWDLFKKQNQICAITGDYISNIEKASLDRIDSNFGYIEGNVQWVTKQANLSKHTMTMNELYEFCKKVLNYANQQPSTPLTKCEGSETNS